MARRLGGWHTKTRNNRAAAQESIIAEASAIVEVITVLVEPDADTMKGTLRAEVLQVREVRNGGQWACC
jgi:hypothetical protein